MVGGMGIIVEVHVEQIDLVVGRLEIGIAIIALTELLRVLHCLP